MPKRSNPCPTWGQVLSTIRRPRVTITGADDRVMVPELFSIAEEFPFVEWGILYSVKRAGTPRFPTLSWIRSLIMNAGPTDRLALHLCGAQARQAVAGYSTPLLSRAFGRVQINGYVPGQPYGLADLADQLGTRFILQCRDPEQLGAFLFDANEMGGADVLLDGSGGEGKLPDWRAWSKRVRLSDISPDLARNVGFAGGIGPTNVLDVIEAIGPRPWVQRGAYHWDSYWIDMESYVRDVDNQFSLDHVRRVLTQVATLPDDQWMPK